MTKKRTLGILALGVLSWGLYHFHRQLIGRWLNLRPVRYGVSVRRKLRIVMPDGVALMADHYAPKGERLYPTILIRTPYGRSSTTGITGLMPAFVAQRFAERGYNVVVQDVRGRFDSEGEFKPFVYEAKDGRATFEWLENQPWFNGVLGMWGQSYVGYVQWAVAPGAPLYLKALLPAISGSKLPLVGVRDRALGLDMLTRWMVQLDAMQPRGGISSLLRLRRLNPLIQERIVAKVARHLPLSEADQWAVGEQSSFYQTWLEHPDTDGEFWQAVDHSRRVGRVTAAVHLVSGWYDILLRETLDDYRELVTHHQKPYLTIGPWAHNDVDCFWESLRQGIVWFDAHLKGDRNQVREKPVRIFIMGKNEWTDLDVWPPPVEETRYYLYGAKDGSGGKLHLDEPSDSIEPSVYIYDPKKPTPSLGGPLMSLYAAGSVDNRKLEARSDVLLFTTAPLSYNVTIVGSVRLRLYVHSSLKYTDFFGRLCDVHPDGRSMNICDGLLRLDGSMGVVQPDGSRQIEISLGATAYSFLKDHCIRLQISSGAHPRWSRNPGSGEPLGSETQLNIAEQQIYHDCDHLSILFLPVTNV
jgi:putative CocE/NonD family hydrolase